MKKALKILLIGSGLWYLGEGMFGPLFAIFSERIGGDILEITFAWSVYLLVMGTLTIILGKYSDKLNKGKMMVLGYALNALFTFGYLLVDSPYKLVLIQGGLGIATAMATPTWNALYVKYGDRKRDGEEWGLADGIPYIITGIAILMGGFIVSNYSFTLLFLIMGTIQLIATIYQIRILFIKHSKIKR